MISRAFTRRMMPPLMKLFSISSMALIIGMPGIRKREHDIIGYSGVDDGNTNCVLQATMLAANAVMAVVAYVWNA